MFDCSAISLAALSAPAKILAEAAMPLARQNPLKDLTCQAFAEQLNTTFRICASPAQSIEVKLVEVTVKQDRPLKPGQGPRRDAGNERFSLIFSGRRSELLGQNTYTFEHEVLGKFVFFIVPVFTRDPRKIDYQLVVNRPRKDGCPRALLDGRGEVAIYGPAGAT